MKKKKPNEFERIMSALLNAGGVQQQRVEGPYQLLREAQRAIEPANRILAKKGLAVQLVLVRVLVAKR
jgi:hypothetical protein